MCWYSCSCRRKEGNVPFNDKVTWHVLKTLDNERRNPLVPTLGLLLFPFAANDLLYAPSNVEDSTYHGFCYYAICGSLAEKRNSSLCLPGGVDPLHDDKSFYH